MKNIGDYIYDLIAVSLFCISAVLLFGMARQLKISTLKVKNFVTEKNILYEAQPEEAFSKNVSKTQMIATLSAGIAYDTEIDGQLLEKRNFNYRFFNFKALASSYYKSYILDESGEIQKVIYRKAVP